MFDQYKSIFEKAKKDNLIHVNPWLGLFGLQQDPFSMEVIEPSDKLKFVPRKIYDDLLYKIALCQRNVKSRVIVTGSLGSGKTFVLKALKLISDKNSSLKGHYINFYDLFRKHFEERNARESNEEIDEEPGEDTFTAGSSESIKNLLSSLDYILIDHASGEQFNQAVKLCANIKCIIFTMAPAEYEHFYLHQRSSENVLDPVSQFVLDKYELDTPSLKNIVNDRFELFTEKGETPLTVDALFDESLVNYMGTVSFHNPGIFMKIIRIFLESMVKESAQRKITRQMIEYQVDMLGLKTCMSNSKERNEISDKKMEILSMLSKAKKGLTPANITEKMNVTPNNTSLHLKTLLELHLIEFTRSGKNRFYTVTIGGQYLVDKYILEHN
nr:hypothetical protein [Candidatus Sigynarchaeota archaeon]